MRVKSNLLLLLLIIGAVFLLNGCGENEDQGPTEKVPQEVTQSEPTSAISETLSDEEQLAVWEEQMRKQMTQIILAFAAYEVDNWKKIPENLDTLFDYGYRKDPAIRIDFIPSKKKWRGYFCCSCF